MFDGDSLGLAEFVMCAVCSSFPRPACFHGSKNTPDHSCSMLMLGRRPNILLDQTYRVVASILPPVVGCVLLLNRSTYAFDRPLLPSPWTAFRPRPSRRRMARGGCCCCVAGEPPPHAYSSFGVAYTYSSSSSSTAVGITPPCFTTHLYSNRTYHHK